ncbi:MAG TPA: hypothetical protein PLI53_05585 [Geobacteraceae bacterium]|nr:hypothetical protein [Geobacteraceae bacterium]
MNSMNSSWTAKRFLVIRCISLVVAIMASVLIVQAASAASWDSTTLKMNPVRGEAVAYFESNCTAPGAQGYMVFQDKPGVTYSYVGNYFNDKASCITLGPRTRVKIYQHKNFKGKTMTISNTDYDAIKQVELSGWWNDTMSSIKVWAQ